MTGWHLVKTECRCGDRSVIVPWYYLEQQETHRYIAHTWEKVTEKNGEQWQIASPSHYWSLLPQCVCHTGGPTWTMGSDTGREFWLCYINLRWVFSTCQQSFCFRSSGELGTAGEPRIIHTTCLIFDYVIFSHQGLIISYWQLRVYNVWSEFYEYEWTPVGWIQTSRLFLFLLLSS